MPTDEERRKLIRDRDYSTDRLSEISQELTRMSVESAALKQEMEGAAPPDADRLKAIRRRRLYLGRYSDELKAERQRVTLEHTRLSAELAGGSTGADPNKRR